VILLRLEEAETRLLLKAGATLLLKKNLQLDLQQTVLTLVNGTEILVCLVRLLLALYLEQLVLSLIF
jgi:hypothetical protein